MAESGERKQALFYSYKGTNPIYKGPTLMTSSNPNYFQTPNTITLGVGFQHMNYGGDTNTQSRTTYYSTVKTYKIVKTYTSGELEWAIGGGTPLIGAIA